MGQRGFLCFLQIKEKCSCCNDPAVIITNAQSIQRTYMKMIF